MSAQAAKSKFLTLPLFPDAAMIAQNLLFDACRTLFGSEIHQADTLVSDFLTHRHRTRGWTAIRPAAAGKTA